MVHRPSPAPVLFLSDPPVQGLIPSVALNRNLFETVIKDLLLEGTEHCVEVYEGTGSTWKLAK